MANTVIGIDLLEQLMFSLYPEAETIYREYLQNACDSINEAAELGILANKEDGHVTINIDKYHRRITIEDNGTGLQSDIAEATLKNIACSNKRKKTAAGFYGIGRLVGGGYCQKLTFITSSINESVSSKMVFDMDMMRDVIRQSRESEDLVEAAETMDRVTTFDNTIPEESDKHYFKVVLENILPDYDELLEEDKIRKYLIQVGPIPYSPIFYNNLIQPNLTVDNNKFLDYYNDLNAVKVTINNFVAIEKPYEIKFKGTEAKIPQDDGTSRDGNASMNKIRFFSISDPKEGDLAWGWYAYTPAGTQIKETDPYTQQPVLTRSIRLRCHNIQVGDENVLNKYFKQSRSHVYFNGEIFIINDDIKPTPDRSDLSPSPITKRFQVLLEKLFREELEKLYQEANKASNQFKKIEEANEQIRELQNTPVNEDFPEESKQKQLEEAQEKKQKALKELNRIQKKGEYESENSPFKQISDDIASKLNAHESFESYTPNSIPSQPKTPSKSLDEEIDELVDKYGKEKISMLRKIFHIIDTRYLRKYEAIVRNIKNSVINDLKK